MVTVNSFQIINAKSVNTNPEAILEHKYVCIEVTDIAIHLFK